MSDEMEIVNEVETEGNKIETEEMNVVTKENKVSTEKNEENLEDKDVILETEKIVKTDSFTHLTLKLLREVVCYSKLKSENVNPKLNDILKNVEIVFEGNSDSFQKIGVSMIREKFTLFEMMRQKDFRWDIETFKKYTFQLWEQLADMKKMGIVHHDIKPENILYNESEDIFYFIDFGFSEFNHLFPKKHYCGSPLYMPLEKLGNSPNDSKSDVWSMGCIMLELFHIFADTNLKRIFDTDCMHPFDPLPGYCNVEAIEKMVERILFYLVYPEYLFSLYYKNLKKHYQINLRKTSTKGVQVYDTRYVMIENLFNQIFHLDPHRRISAKKILHHDFYAKQYICQDVKDNLKNNLREQFELAKANFRCENIFGNSHNEHLTYVSERFDKCGIEVYFLAMEIFFHVPDSDINLTNINSMCTIILELAKIICKRINIPIVPSIDFFNFLKLINFVIPVSLYDMAMKKLFRDGMLQDNSLFSTRDIFMHALYCFIITQNSLVKTLPKELIIEYAYYWTRRSLLEVSQRSTDDNINNVCIDKKIDDMIKTIIVYPSPRHWGIYSSQLKLVEYQNSIK